MRLDRKGQVHILDLALARQSVLDDHGRFLWSTPIPPGVAAPTFYALPDSGLIVSTLVTTPASIGYSFHRTNRERIAVSFGPAVPIVPPKQPDVIRFVVGTARPVGFWAVRVLDSFVIEHRLDSGALQRRWSEALPWLSQPAPTFDDGALGGPGAPQFIDVAEFADSLLIALATVPGNEWRRGYGPAVPDSMFRGPNGEQRRVHRVIDHDLAHATRIVAFDPIQGQIVADTIVNRHLVWFADSHHLVGYTETNGEPVITVWTITISKGRKP